METKARPLSPSSGEIPAHHNVDHVPALSFILFRNLLIYLFFLSHEIIQAFSVSLNQPAGTHAEATAAETWSNL